MLNWFKQVLSTFENSRNVAASPPSADDSLRKIILLDKSEEHKKQGNEFLAKGLLEEAAECYRQSVAINPDHAEGFLNLGFVLKQLKRNEDAEQNLKQAILINPELVDAYYLLGALLQERGSLDGAIENYNKALELKPDFEIVYRDLYHALILSGQSKSAEKVIKQGISKYPASAEFYFYLGNLFISEMELEQAIACYQKVLLLQPHYAEAHRLLGDIFLGQGNLEDAQVGYSKALGINPNDADTLNKLGSVYQDQGDLENAQLYYRKALEFNPDDANAQNNLGTLFQDQGDLKNAQVCFRKAIAQNPKFFEAYNNLGNVYTTEGEQDAAISCYHQALQLKPDSAEANNNLGNLYRNQGDFNKAIACYRKALELKPDFSEAYDNLGNVLIDQGSLDEAISCYRQALVFKPNYFIAHNNLGMVLQEQGKLDQALACYRQALQSAQEVHAGRIKMNLLHVLQHLCEWKDLEKLGAEVRRVVCEAPPTDENQISPFSFLTMSGSTLQEQGLCASNWARRIRHSLMFMQTQMQFEFKRELKQKINIGYLSADFGNHALSYLMAQVFEFRDHNRFQITAYSYKAKDGSVMRKRLEKSFDYFVDIRGLSDEDAANKIYEDGIDILVDLTGYTRQARSAIPALRPAPVQVNYLGYPGSMGGEFIDYLIADRFIIPPESQQYYAEKVVRLPNCYQPRDVSCGCLAAPSRKDCGLPEDGFVFCDFNQAYKITPEIFDVWCSLLMAVPGSVLWLLSSNTVAESNLSQEAVSRGVAPERIVYAPKLKFEEHLARIQCADLFLDTYPVNAHTTCSDALWVGLPVITCAGETFASRVAGSLLTALGVPELIACNLKDYYTLSLDLATDKRKYERIRNKILSNRESSPLFDSAQFTRDLEKAYLQMWDEYVGFSHAG